MARDGNGLYELPEAPFVNGTTADADEVNSNFSDIAAALTQSLSKDGQTVPTANLPMGGFKLTGLGAGSGSGESVRYEQLTTLLANLVSSKPIGGLTYANNAGDATNDIDIATGGCADSTGAVWMTLGSALTKRLDASWAVGTNQGGILSGSASNVDYNIWLISRSDTGVVDVGFEDVASATPTLPTNYTHYRKIGWFKRSGGAILAFKTYELEGGGIDFAYAAGIRDINLANTLTTSRRTDALSVPTSFSVLARLRTLIHDASSSGLANVTCPDETDAAPSATDVPLSTDTWTTGSQAIRERFIRTSATGTIAARANLATVDTYIGVTLGFQWGRR